MTNRIQSVLMKALNLFHSSGRIERAQALLEIRWNWWFFSRKPVSARSVEEALINLGEPIMGLFHGEAPEALLYIRNVFENRARKNGQGLPFPIEYNADKSFAMLVYAFARCLKTATVLETGVGYGITSALVLLALQHNNCGTLTSIDLPPLSDPQGFYTGFAVPDELRERWRLNYGSSRRLLPRLLGESANIGLFISDSANVYTLQKYEFDQVFPALAAEGADI